MRQGRPRCLKTNPPRRTGWNSTFAQPSESTLKKKRVIAKRNAISRSLRQNKQGRKPFKKKRRTTSEFNRIYGSTTRVEWIKRRPSVVGAELPCVNAHVRNGGMGRKADAKWIVPMTDEEHRLLHGIGKIPFETLYMLDLDDEAMKTEAAWQAELARRAA